MKPRRYLAKPGLGLAIPSTCGVLIKIDAFFYLDGGFSPVTPLFTQSGANLANLSPKRTGYHLAGVAIGIWAAGQSSSPVLVYIIVIESGLALETSLLWFYNPGKWLSGIFDKKPGCTASSVPRNST